MIQAKHAFQEIKLFTRGRFRYPVHWVLNSKIEKVPRGIQVESRVKTWQVRGIWSQKLEHQQVQKRGMELGVQKDKRSLLACHARCKCSMETTHNSVKVKLGIKVIKLVESLFGWEVTVGQGSECLECNLFFSTSIEIVCPFY